MGIVIFIIPVFDHAIIEVFVLAFPITIDSITALFITLFLSSILYLYSISPLYTLDPD